MEHVGRLHDSLLEEALRELEGVAIPGDAAIVTQVLELGLPGSWHLNATGRAALRDERLRRKTLARVRVKIPKAIKKYACAAQSALLKLLDAWSGVWWFPMAA
jgi:hypothetical protein